MNEFYLGFTQNGVAYIVNNYTQILNVASQCPYAGGEAVYQARAMINLVNDSAIYNDITVCLQNGIYRNGDNAKGAESKFLILPNPASDDVTITISGKETAVKDIYIVNALGQLDKLIWEYSGTNTIRFNVKQVTAGLYLIRLHKADGEVVSGKLQVTR